MKEDGKRREERKHTPYISFTHKEAPRYPP
jgi:hypothetical protein